MRPRRHVGSLQRAIAASSAEFIEVVISGDDAVELRVDRRETRLGMATPAASSWLLCDACDPGATGADHV